MADQNVAIETFDTVRVQPDIRGFRIHPFADDDLHEFLKRGLKTQLFDDVVG